MCTACKIIWYASGNNAMAQILPDSIDGQGTIIAKYPEMLAEVLYSR